MPHLRLVRPDDAQSDPPHGVYTEPGAIAGWTHVTIYRHGATVADGHVLAVDVTPALLRGFACYWCGDGAPVVERPTVRAGTGS